MAHRFTLPSLRCLALAAFLWLPAPVSGAPAVVILVRHAEKETVPDDPSLSAAGKKRAAELARVLSAWTAAGGKVRALFVTDLKRTQETLAPVAAATGVAVTVVDGKAPDTLVRKILAVHGGVVVVAGHSNTVPGIIHALGGPGGIEIADAAFDRLFVLTAPGAAQSHLVVLRYGE